jgi:hypothetical protein
MIKKPQVAKQTQQTLIITGAVLTFGWALVLAVTTWLTDLPCVISPNNCTDGASLANLILYSPLVAGAIMLPIGFIYKNKQSREIKFTITLIGACALLFIAFWLIVFVGISIHGLRG